MSLAAFAGLAFASAHTASAAWIIPVGVTATSEHSTPNDAAINTINGSGLSAENATGLHAAANNVSWSFAQGNDLKNDAESMTIDLGALYDLTDIHIWQFTRNSVSNDANRGVNQFDVLVSADNSIFNEVITNANLTKALNSGGLPTGNEPVQSFALVQTGVRYITIGVDSTHEGNSDWQGGIGEVRFEGTAVPEPTTTALLGLGGIALILRRRK
jgi:hypothetical protein